MKAGDLVICMCDTDTWYKGVIGLLVGFSELTKDPMVMYPGGRVLRLARARLEVFDV